MAILTGERWKGGRTTWGPNRDLSVENMFAEERFGARDQFFFPFFYFRERGGVTRGERGVERTVLMFEEKLTTSFCEEMIRINEVV